MTKDGGNEASPLSGTRQDDRQVGQGIESGYPPQGQLEHPVDTEDRRSGNKEEPLDW